MYLTYKNRKIVFNKSLNIFILSSPELLLLPYAKLLIVHTGTMYEYLYFVNSIKTTLLFQIITHTAFDKLEAVLRKTKFSGLNISHNFWDISDFGIYRIYQFIGAYSELGLGFIVYT